MSEYAKMVASLAKPGKDIYMQVSYGDCHMMHMLLGLAGEVGELIDAAKKNIIYGKPLDMDNVIEELGDIEFYLEGVRQGYAIRRDEAIQKNMDKLQNRYGEVYSDEAANQRKDKA